MFSLDLKGGLPIYEQLYNRITELIVSETLKEDEKLPTIRDVAKELGVNPNTVQKSYQLLERDSIIYSVPAKGSYVAKKSATVKTIQSKALIEFQNATERALLQGVTFEELSRTLKSKSDKLFLNVNPESQFLDKNKKKGKDGKTTEGEVQ